MSRSTVSRVLVVASTFPAADDDPVPRFVRDQVLELKKAYPRVSFSVLAPHDARSHTDSFAKHRAFDEYRFHYFWPYRLERLVGRGIVPTLRQNPAYYGLVPCLVIGELFALLRLCRRLKPDVIYAHWFTPQGITAGFTSMIMGIPFVYTSHSSDVAILRKVPIVGPFLVRHFTRKAQAVSVVSRRSRDQLKAFFDDDSWAAIDKKVSVIPMGISMPSGNIARSEKQSERLGTILFMGRLAEKKGVQYLLPAFARLHSWYPAATLCVAGDGPWLARLQRQVDELQLSESVTFSGYVSGEKKAHLLADADVFVVPSIITDDGDAEGLPVALLEGLTAGKICIATNESGADAVIRNGWNGWLVPQKDVDALAAALKRALDLQPGERRVMREAARSALDLFNWGTIAQRHYDCLFESLLHSEA